METFGLTSRVVAAAWALDTLEVDLGFLGHMPNGTAEHTQFEVEVLLVVFSGKLAVLFQF